MTTIRVTEVIETSPDKILFQGERIGGNYDGAGVTFHVKRPDADELRDRMDEGHEVQVELP